MTKENNIDDYQIQTINLYINIIIYINIIKRHRLAGWADGVYREFSIITRTDFNRRIKPKPSDRIFPVYILLFCACPAPVPLYLFFKTLNLYLTDSVTVLVENSL